MRSELSSEQIEQYQQNGFLVIEDFLSEKELETWREAVSEAVEKRHGNKLPNRASVYGEGDDKEKEYYDQVFEQLINLWKDNPKIKDLILDKRIGKMAAQLSGADGIRPWHDQALIKKPWANPTTLHLDTPYWSFSDKRALSIWIALDDATLENGCLFFLPGTHKKTNLKVAGIGKNNGDIFKQYPELKQRGLIPYFISPGSSKKR
jgi:ectoine hydroxylase-related dioxygenase (phytanoyl-CoA dioxygenase family)